VRNVALVKSNDRYEAVTKALEAIRGDIHLPDKPVLIKPNLVMAKKPNGEVANSHPDAIHAALDFLKGLGVTKFIIADGPGMGEPLAPVLDAFGYRELAKRYNIEFRDLNSDKPVEITLLDKEMKPKVFAIAKTMVDCYRVSLSVMKTHNVVVVTLAIKNTVIGSLVGKENKPTVHQGYQAMNISMARIASFIPNDLSIIDGVVGMEGEGPVDGTEIRSGVALASVDPLACDTIGTEVMGYDPDDVGYLWYLKQTSGFSRRQVRVLGERVAACKTKYKPHSKYLEQLNWHVSNWQEFFPRAAAA